MDKFFIDRQFGQPIWVDVENSIVLRCYNESETYNARMNELYAGRTITFLNEDFIGRAMKGTYHHLRPEAIYTIHQQIDSKKMEIRNIWNIISSLTTLDAQRAPLREKVKELEIEQYGYEKKLITEKLRILNEHNFLI